MEIQLWSLYYSEKILLPDSSQAPHPTSEAAVKLTNFREQPLLCPSKTSTVEVNSALQEATTYNIKIKYSGLSAMQLQIISMINTVIMSKDGYNFSLTWGASRVDRLYLHVAMVTWSDAAESAVPPNAKAPPASPTLYLFLTPDRSTRRWKTFKDIQGS